MTDQSSGYSQVLKATDGNTTVYYTRGFELITRRKGDVASYYLYDGGLSVRALTDETGAITDTLVFDAFGNETEKTGSTANTYKFQGEEQDATGLYYLRARYMDPVTGTFTSMDTYAGSLSDPMSLHKYLFANSNPVMYSDPSGHFSLVEFELSEAIDEIIMSSLSFGMAYIGMVKDDPNMSDTEKFSGYLTALGFGVLFPFGLALIHALFSVLVAGVILATLSLVLSLISRGIDYEKHPTVAALLKISAGATFAAALASLGNAFIQNAKKADELIHAEANSYGNDKYYYQDSNGRWHGKDGKFVSSSEATGRTTSDEHYLHRPYIRKDTINKINNNTLVNNKTGEIYDKISRKWVKPRNIELGHTQGNEFWYWRAYAESHGWSQAKFNDFMNNPNFYAWQGIHSNRSHLYEGIHF